MPTIYTFNVIGKDLINAGIASQQIKKILESLGIEKDIIRKISIALYEGEINMVIHANGGQITCVFYEDKLLLELRDKGPGIKDVQKCMQPGYSTATEEIREMGFGAGMGLYNMQKNSDFLCIDTVVGMGTTITMEIFLEKINESK
ncbi:MAG: ATP-binding protein [Eubacteriales bacterium]|nr:ATP-binding protein [Eubacteriales bacterium]